MRLFFVISTFGGTQSYRKALPKQPDSVIDAEKMHSNQRPMKEYTARNTPLDVDKVIYGCMKQQTGTRRKAEENTDETEREREAGNTSNATQQL